jgi:glycosyltransferase involved in cell wall biosynthesis
VSQEAQEEGSQGRRIITHVAYFAPYKGQDLFLEFAAACLQGGLNAEFWLVGEVLYPAPEYVAYAERLRARASEPDLAGRVKFWGGLRAPQVLRLLEQSHLLVHCTREPEPFGRTLIEALLCGCEVVAHRGSGACEVAHVMEGLPVWLPEAAQAVLGSGVGVAKPYVSLERSAAVSALAEVSPDAMADVLVDGKVGDAVLGGQ